MIKTSQEGQILFTGLTVSDLLLRIEQIFDAKMGAVPSTENPQSDYITRKEAARLLKISLPTLHDWTLQGFLTSYKMGKRVLFRRDEIEAALQRANSNKHKKGGWR
jgi:excisionase family DNA binding protein